MKIDILGAGIGGLTTTVAFEQKGINYDLYESAEEIKLAGTGIILANNAMQVFKKLGLAKELESLGNPVNSLNITKPDLKPLSKANLSRFEQKYKVRNIAIHRGILQKLLIDNINQEKLHLGKRLVAVTKPQLFELDFDDSSKISSEAIIGADGIHSIVRKYIYPNHSIRKAKQVCWRGVIDFELPMHLKNELNEAWGDNKRFGFVQISENKVYWYALTAFNNNINEFNKEELEIYFKDFHPIIKELIKNTSVDSIHTDEISDLLPISNWVKDNACLLGDAAHAMTPNMGQGACQAIEDAFILSECLEKYPLEEALKTYQKLRIDKAKFVVKTSWQVGKMAHVGSPFLANMINFMLKNTPVFITNRQSEKLFQLASV